MSHFYYQFGIREVLFIMLMTSVTSVNNAKTAEYCESEAFEASCPNGEVIMMTKAKYGRMALGRCIKQSYGQIGCNVDVLDVMDSFCSGKSVCSLFANHQALIKKKKLSCSEDLAAYLEASSECQRVASMDSGGCGSQGYTTLTKTNGFISPTEGQQQNNGRQCSWRIKMPAGIIVNITMYNYLPTPASNQALITSSACYEVGTIKENGKSKTIHKCLSDPRYKTLYVSNGGEIDISFTNSVSTSVTGAFLLHFEGMGCTNPPVPEHSKFQRLGNQAKIMCENSDQTWQLVCQEDTWIGDIGRCVSDSESSWSFLGIFNSNHPYGTAIVVGLGATLGVLIGGILLYILIMIFKRCQGEDQRNYDYTDTTFAHIPPDYHAEKTGLFQDNLFDQKFNTLSTQQADNVSYPYNSNTINRDNTNHSRVPLPPLPNGNNTLSYEKPLYNKNNTSY